jgi:hypothetical protein
MLTFFFNCAGICSDPRAEASRVTTCLNAAGPHDNVVAKIFWADRTKAYTLALLQDRVAQVGDFFESCQAVLAFIHKVMFLLNDQPEGLHALMTRFKNGSAIYRFVRQHLFCGARVALAIVRVRYPGVNMNAVGTLPATCEGVTEMAPHYAAGDGAAKKIALQIITESHRERAAVEQQ